MKTNTVNNETAASYAATGINDTEDCIIKRALDILQARIDARQPFTSSESVRDYLIVRNSQLEHEVFGMMLLDNQHKLIELVDVGRGTIDGAAVYPRELVKIVLQHNAAAVILYHNHPSGKPEPSQADISTTGKVVAALQTIEVRVLDHIIVGGGESSSFAEKGLI